MTANLFRLPKQVPITSGGTPHAGAKAYFFEPGTSTPKDTYTTTALTTTHAHPVVADANGVFAPIFLDASEQYDLTLNTSADALIYSVANVNDEMLSQSIIAQLLNPQTPPESSSGAVPSAYQYLSGRPVYDVSRYGASSAASASANSTAIQMAADVAYAAGGGVVYVPAGTYDIDAPIRIKQTVSLVGDGKNTSILRKTTSTASSVSDNTTRFWDSASVGNPVCVVHFVAHDGTTSWSYGEVRDIGVMGDTTSPNTTAVEYGFFFRGAIGSRIRDTFAQYVKVGYFFGGGGTITSEVAQNNAGNVQRGFYQHFMTSTTWHHNYAVNYRYVGYFLSWYYSHVHSNAADRGGDTWKSGTTEIALAYHAHACRGGVFSGNGCETHNGSVFKSDNCIGTRFANNTGLDISSNYTGGSDICLFENDSNNACEYTNNRVQTSGMTGTGARHFIYKITSELGSYLWQRNRFVASVSDTSDTSTWTNISGSISETTPTVYVSTTSFTPTVAGSTTPGTTTYTAQEGKYERIGNTVHFRLRVSWSNQTGTGNIVVGGLPLTSANTDDVPCSVVAGSLTFSNQLAALVDKNATTVRLYSQATGAAITGVAIDTAADLWISGSYLVP